MKTVRFTVGIAAAAALSFSGVASAQTHADRAWIRSSRSGRSRPGSAQPVQMEFIGDNDFFVLEKPTGQVKRVKDGVATRSCST